VLGLQMEMEPTLELLGQWQLLLLLLQWQLEQFVQAMEIPTRRTGPKDGIDHGDNVKPHPPIAYQSVSIVDRAIG
jgi:hypothetical protein